MCELLIFVANNTNPDPEKDRRGCYKRGMPVVVFEDGHVWGREESKQVWIAEGGDPNLWPQQGRLAILKIPGVPAAKAQALLDEQAEDDAGVPLLNPDGSRVVFRRRRWCVLYETLPQGVINTVLADGEYTTTVTAIRNYIKRIRDNAQYTGLD